MNGDLLFIHNGLMLHQDKKPFDPAFGRRHRILDLAGVDVLEEAATISQVLIHKEWTGLRVLNI